MAARTQSTKRRWRSNRTKLHSYGLKLFISKLSLYFLAAWAQSAKCRWRSNKQSYRHRSADERLGSGVAGGIAQNKVSCSLAKQLAPQQPVKSTFMVIDSDVEHDSTPKKRAATDAEGGAKKPLEAG